MQPAGTGSPILLAYLMPPGADSLRQYLDRWLELKAIDGFRATQIDYWINGEPRAQRRPRWNLLDALFAPKALRSAAILSEVMNPRLGGSKLPSGSPQVQI